MKSILKSVIFFLSLTPMFGKSQTEIWGVAETRIFKMNANADSVLFVSNCPQTSGSIIEATNKKLYGLSNGGGTFNKGTIYEYNRSTNAILTRKNMTDSTGYSSSGTSLTQFPNGLICGVTSYGGRFGLGTLFTFDLTNDSLQVLVHFSNQPRGYKPTLASNGKIYGTVVNGGANNQGYVYSYDTLSRSFTIIHDFNNTDGSLPYAGLFEASNGVLYGTTSRGGGSNLGVIYSIDKSNNAFNVLYNPTSAVNGGVFQGGLAEPIPGLLYGCAAGGSGDGVIFSFDINTNIYTKKANLINSTTGRISYGTFLKANNGKLYNTTIEGGTNNQGKVFEYDLVKDTVIGKGSFTNSIGRPNFLELIEVCALPKPFAPQLPDTSFYCQTSLLDTPKASSCYGTIIGVPNKSFPITTPGTNNVIWTYDDGHGNYSTQSHVITILTNDTSIVFENNTLIANQKGASYQWIECNTKQPIPLATNDTFMPIQNGSYAIVITSGACADTSRCFTISNLGISDFTISKGLHVYPNPTKSTVTVVLDKNSISPFELVDLNGRLILEGTFTAKENILDLKNIENGLYILKTGKQQVKIGKQ